MVSLGIHNHLGVSTGELYSVDECCFAVSVNRALLRSVLTMYSNNRRVGTVKSKSRAEVSGSSKKLYKQKGTGNARAGNKRTPVRRGGGHCFAKSPRDWRIVMPRRSVRAAAGMAILSKFNSSRVILLDDFHFDVPHTASVASMLKVVGVGGASCLFAVASYDEIAWKSCRNIPGVTLSVASDINADSVIRSAYLLVTRAALEVLCVRFSR